MKLSTDPIVRLGDEKLAKKNMEVTGDLSGPSVEWWGAVSGTGIGENGRKDNGDVKHGLLVTKLGEIVHACVLIGTQVKKDRSMGRYSGRRETMRYRNW